MTIHVEEMSSGCRLCISGEMTVVSAAATHAQIRASLRPGSSDEVEVDLSGVIELDTAGLQIMLQLKREYGAGLRFVNHSPAVLRILDLSNLGGRFGDPLVIRQDEPASIKS